MVEPPTYWANQTAHNQICNLNFKYDQYQPFQESKRAGAIKFRYTGKHTYSIDTFQENPKMTMNEIGGYLQNIQKKHHEDNPELHMEFDLHRHPLWEQQRNPDFQSVLQLIVWEGTMKQLPAWGLEHYKKKEQSE